MKRINIFKNNIEKSELDYDRPEVELTTKLIFRQTQECKQGFFSRPAKYKFFTSDNEKKYEAECDPKGALLKDAKKNIVGRIITGHRFSGKRDFDLYVDDVFLGKVDEEAIIKRNYYVKYKDMVLDGNVFATKCTLKDKNNHIFMTAKFDGEEGKLEYNNSLMETEAILLFLIQMIPWNEDRGSKYVER